MTRLKLWRLTNQVPQVDLAARLRIHPTVLSRIECGWIARPPKGFEKHVRRVMGPNWTFEKCIAVVTPDELMKPAE
jgi:hypothetical protein